MLVVHLVRINCALPSTSTGSQLILILDCLNWVYAFLCFILSPVPGYHVHHVYQQCCCPEGMNHEISFHLHTTLFTSASLFWAFNFIDFEIYANVLTNLATL